MEDEIITGQTSEEDSQVDNPDIDEGAEDALSDASFEDGEGKDGTAEPEPTKAMQTKEQNSEFARKRREAERKAEMKALREKTILETLGGTNPYTGKEMKDSQDIAEFELMREIKAKGGDPVLDYAEYHKARERDNVAKEEQAEKDRDWYRRDLESFKAKYPAVKIEELSRDERFNDYADGKVGRKPLSEIYEGYQRFIGESIKTANNKAAQAVANRAASPGALTGQGAPAGGFFTKEQVEKMSPAEVDKNYEKILKSAKHW